VQIRCVRISVLGPLTLDDSAARLSPRETLVLAALALAGDESLSADQLSEVVWGETPPASWHKNLQTCVVRLRKVLGPAAIETTGHGYRLTLAVDAVDARRFEALATRGHELLELGEADRAAYLLGQALALWRGRPYTELEEWERGSLEASRLSELRLDAQEWWLDASVQAGRQREILAQAVTLANAAPLRERRWELLALAQYRAGRQGEALRTIAAVRRRLVDELGIDPGQGLTALERAILRQDPDLDTAEVRQRAGEVCPYLGLMPYDVDDNEGFFGRDRDIRLCRERLEAEGVLAVLGPSGSGKSSLVRAGIVAALRREGQHCDVLTPGPHPVGALPPPRTSGKRRPLVVDQAEELFSLCHDQDERERFVELLADHAEVAPMVLVLRADRMGDVSAHPALAQLVERGLYVLPAMSPDDLRAAIEGPARQAGLIVEPGLTDLLVREVENEPGALPLLSHALQETWLRREGRTLTVAGYQASGGIRQAVAQSAESLYGELDPDQRRALHDLLLRLVSPGTEGEPVRSRLPRRQVVAHPAQNELVDRLVRSRLVTSDDGIVEIAHEALVRAWPRLRGWLEDDIEGQRILHHISASADAWNSLGRPPSELYRGVRLAQALEWQDRPHPDLTSTEREFLDAGADLAEAEDRAAADQAKRQSRLIQRLRIVLAGAAVLLVVALAAGGIAAVQSDRATENATKAEQLAVSADARRVGVRAQLTDDISLSLLLAAAGARLADVPETRANLVTALAERPSLVRSARPAGGYLEVFDVSRDGRWVASSDDQNRMHLYDASTNRLLRTYDAGRSSGDQALLVPAFSPDSRQLAVILKGSKSTEPVRLLDPNTMQPTAKLDFPGSKPVWGIDGQFSADGRHLAATVQTVNWREQDASEASGYAVVWDLRSPSTPPIRVPTGTGFQVMALSPDGQILYTGLPLRAYDVASGDRIWAREEVTSDLPLDINTEGTLLAVADRGNANAGKKVLLVNASTGATVLTLRGHRDVVGDVRFSPDGSLVGSVADDGELVVWDTATGRPLQRWHTSDPLGVGFGPDGDLVYGGYGDSMLRTWDRSMEDTYLQQTTQVGDGKMFAHADFSPDGQQVAYSWLDGGTGWVRFVDTVTGEATPPARVSVSAGPWASGAWHPQSRRYVATCVTGLCADPLMVLDPVTGRVLEKREFFNGDVYSIAYVDGGRSLLVGGSIVPGGAFDRNSLRTVRVEAETLRPRDEPFDIPNHNGFPIGDGSTAMVYLYSPDLLSSQWQVIDFSTGDVLSEGDLDLSAYAFVASMDGSTVAMAGDTGEIVTIDVSTGAELRRSTGLGAPVLWLKYSDDGELLVSGADDGGVSLWDAATLDLLGTVYPPHPGDPNPAGAQFIGDSHDVAIASYDGRIYRWETDLDHAIDFACQMAGRNLTEEEWKEFLPAQPYQSVCPDE
jgi:WD40 repeat protein/DNA-binding SARP family transcriptional activator